MGRIRVSQYPRPGSTTRSPLVALSARHIASPLPRAGPYSLSTSSWWITRAPSAPRDVGRPVARAGIDDHQLVDKSGRRERIDRISDHATDRVRTFLGRDHDA